MTENVMVRMKQNLAILGLRNTHENIDEYLGNAIDNKVSITEFLDLIFEREAKAKVNRSVEHQIKMAGFRQERLLNYTILIFNQTLIQI